MTQSTIPIDPDPRFVEFIQKSETIEGETTRRSDSAGVYAAVSCARISRVRRQCGAV